MQLAHRRSSLALYTALAILLSLSFLIAAVLLATAQSDAPTIRIVGLPDGAKITFVETVFASGLTLEASAPLHLAQTQGIELVFATNFDGTLIGPSWTARDANGALNGEYYWGYTDYTHSSAPNSLWAIGNGAQGSFLDPAIAVYPNDVDSWFIIGPIDLGRAADVEMRFHLEMFTQPGDQVQALSSADGNTWVGAGFELDGLNAPDWFAVSARPDDFLGRSAVYFALRFVSNRDNLGGTGVFLDDVALYVDYGHGQYLPIIRRQYPPAPTSPSATATLPAPTSTTPPTQADIKIIQVAAFESLPTAKEYVIIQNIGQTSQNMQGWRLRDQETTYIYVFPAFTLQPSATVKVWTRCGTNDNDELFICITQPLWDVSGDTAYLYDASNNLVDTYSY